MSFPASQQTQPMQQMPPQQPGQPSQQPQQQAGQGTQTTPPHKTGAAVAQAEQNPDDKQRQQAVVKLWTARVKKAREKQRDVFDSMRKCMRFAAGYQWPGQKKLDDNRYVANWTIREVNSKVASLYAKNPTAVYSPRKRLDFALYDGKLESLIPIIQSAQAHPMGLMGLPMQQQALIADYMHGMQQRELIDRIGKTLEVLFQYQLDEQDEEQGDFKLQIKQLVRRTIISKVGYVRVSFVRDSDAFITSSGTGNTVANRALKIKDIAQKVQDGELQRTSTQVETLHSLAIGLGGTMQDKAGLFGENERLVIDCIPSTSVIIDPDTKTLKGFIGSRWIAIEYVLPRADVNALFEADVKANTQTQLAKDKSGQTSVRDADTKEKGDEDVIVWEVLDKQTRSHFYICDGHPDYLSEPEYLTPAVRGFWPLYALTYNDIEADPCGKDGILPFPPSDVELLMSAQREFNRSRNELKKHRIANRPRWMGPNGVLSENDKDNLGNAASGDFIELENIPQGMKPADVFTPFPQRPIDPAVYDSTPQLQDAQLTTGNPQESLGGDSQATATGESITAQNRLTVTASNVDDTDDMLTWLARVSGEMMIQGFSVTTVQRIAGPGATWPQLPQDKQDALAQVYLTTKAASSGRPNQAVDIRNWQMIAPILMQAGANPQFMVRHTLHVFDSNVDPEEAFPLLPTQMPMQGQVPPSGGSHQPSEQQAHAPGQTPPPGQSRPGPSGNQHPQHQQPAHPGSVQQQPQAQPFSQ